MGRDRGYLSLYAKLQWSATDLRCAGQQFRVPTTADLGTREQTNETINRSIANASGFGRAIQIDA